MGVSRRPRVERLTVGGWFRVGAVVFGLLAAVALVAGVLAISNLSDARGRVVDRLDPASRNAEQVVADYLDQETGLRGYSLTANRRFLAPYEAGRRRTVADVDALRRHVRPLGKPELDRAVDAVRAAGQDWSAGYALPTIATIAAHGPLRDSGDVDAGKARFDLLRSRVAALQAGLAAERRRAKSDLNTAAGRLTATFVAVGVLVILGGVAILLILRAIVSRPVERLARRTRRVAQGEFEQPVGVGGPRDIAQLGDDVDSMRQRIVQELLLVEQARAELERSNSELEQFAYVASHDLQEPLRKVASFTQLLKKRYGGELDERADQYIDFAVDGATRMQQLINDLLAFSRVGRLSAEEATVVATDDALDDALATLAEPIADAGAEIEREPLPSVRGERTLLAGVFQNLVGNAIKFRRPDAAPHIRIGVRRDGPMWEFSCTDDGIGVDEEYADRIFMIFQRLHPKDVYPGTGIGLAMCRKIVEYHGGRIWLDADGSPGSTFRFTLPVLPEEPHVPSR
jgi:signal transduction histidine kinase